MMLGLVTLKGAEDELPELCIVPDKPSHLCEAVKVSKLLITDFAVQLLGIEEGFTLQKNDSGAGVILTPMVPAKLYLTPNRADKPGFSVSAAKIVEGTDGTFAISFRREGRDWQDWNPNVRVY